MTENDAIAEATAILESQGFSVEKIPPENDVMRPDLSVKYDDEHYLIEQKTKGDNPQERQKEQQEFEDVRIFDRSKPLQPRSVLSGILEHAIEQIDAHPNSSTAFKVVWMTTWGVWRRANFDSLFKGFYGSQHVFDVDGHVGEMRDCYYLGFADSERHSEIDAIIVVDGENLQMLVNEFSPRYETFMSSKLVEVFCLGVHDPRRVVANGDAYSLKDYSGDRHNREGCLEELAKRLVVERMMVMPMNEIQVVANVGKFIETKQAVDPNA